MRFESEPRCLSCLVVVMAVQHGQSRAVLDQLRSATAERAPTRPRSSRSVRALPSPGTTPATGRARSTCGMLDAQRPARRSGASSDQRSGRLVRGEHRSPRRRSRRRAGTTRSSKGQQTAKLGEVGSRRHEPVGACLRQRHPQPRDPERWDSDLLRLDSSGRRRSRSGLRRMVGVQWTTALGARTSRRGQQDDMERQRDAGRGLVSPGWCSMRRPRLAPARSTSPGRRRRARGRRCV